MRTYWQLYPAGRFAPQESQQAGADACRALLAGCGLSEGADYQIGELLHVGNNGHHNVLERGAAGRCCQVLTPCELLVSLLLGAVGRL
jgi:hypothetical protein